jgi:putative PIN family toxin of toxin-antitoxin system
MILKVILDTNVLISSLAFDAVCEKCLIKCLDNSQIFIYQSETTFTEFKEKIYQGRLDKILKKSKRKLTQKQINSFVEGFLQASKLIPNPIQKINLSRDQGDNKFLELAKEIQADYLITGDKDLLVLKIFEKTKILKPSEFLKESLD